LRKQAIVRPAGRTRFGGSGQRTAALVRVAFVAAVASCALVSAPASNAGVPAGSGAAPAAGEQVNAAVAPSGKNLTLLSSRLANLPVGGVKTTDGTSRSAPVEGEAAPVVTGTAPADDRPVPADSGAAPAGGGGAVLSDGGAAPASAGATPAAGNGDGDGPAATSLHGEYAAYVTAVDPAKATVTLDVVEWFTGTAAQQACVVVVEPGPWEAAWCNDYYVRNRNVVLRTLPVAPAAQLKYVDEMGPADGVSLEDPTGGDVPTTLSALATKLAGLGPDGRLKCQIKVESGAVTAIAEIFTP